MAQRIVDVLVPVALDHAYSYRAPEELDLHVGDIVAVPLGPREALGVVWADNVAVKPGLHNRLKDVAAKLDYPPLKEELRRFVDWVVELHALAQGHGAAHDLAHGRAWPRARARRGAARRSAAAAADARHDAACSPRSKTDCCAPSPRPPRMRASRPA